MLIKKCMYALVFGMLFTTALLAQDAKTVPTKTIEAIRGSWKIAKIMSGTQEVARNPTSGQWIAFRSDGTYVNHGTALDSGSYRLNENQSSLYLESHVNPGKDKDSPKLITEYKITLQDDSMILQRKNEKPAKGKHADKMQYYYVRIGEETSSVK
ncbi:hypothetical protein SAMN04488109_0071 [Chryseolinea serpens]|uniref:Lipocalin-like domain-containing protein n=1 Tax=Chryseolinea serpens TaxID=947013 RepID=A0A1M5JID8_9BACT|nr:hypothetical protein [Chryseolinea serpens]SHG40165.1 hypothetical protein SAMN04488109_0071 [Chryseolinea serpens]